MNKDRLTLLIVVPILLAAVLLIYISGCTPPGPGSKCYDRGYAHGLKDGKAQGYAYACSSEAARVRQ